MAGEKQGQGVEEQDQAPATEQGEQGEGEAVHTYLDDDGPSEIETLGA